MQCDSSWSLAGAPTHTHTHTETLCLAFTPVNQNRTTTEGRKDYQTNQDTRTTPLSDKAITTQYHHNHNHNHNHNHSKNKKPVCVCVCVCVCVRIRPKERTRTNERIITVTKSSTTKTTSTNTLRGIRPSTQRLLFPLRGFTVRSSVITMKFALIRYLSDEDRESIDDDKIGSGLHNITTPQPIDGQFDDAVESDMLIALPKRPMTDTILEGPKRWQRSQSTSSTRTTTVVASVSIATTTQPPITRPIVKSHTRLYTMQHGRETKPKGLVKRQPPSRPKHSKTAMQRIPLCIEVKKHCSPVDPPASMVRPKMLTEEETMRQRGYVKPIGGYGASHVAKGPSPQPFSLMELQRLRVPPELWPGVEVDSDRKFPVRGCDISASDVMCGRGGQSNCHQGIPRHCQPIPSRIRFGKEIPEARYCTDRRRSRPTAEGTVPQEG